MLRKRPRKEFEVIESDLSRYGPDLIKFLKAGEEKNEARKARDLAEQRYQKAKRHFIEVRANFNAAFDSSADKEE